MFVFNVWVCSIYILFSFKRSYLITFWSLHARNFFTSHYMLCVFCVLITCIIMYACICVDCVVSRALKSSLSCLWLCTWISFCVCSRTPVCRVTHYFVCVCPSEYLLGCVRVIAWIYLVLYISVCVFIALVVCMNVCIVFCVCFACVGSCCLCVHMLS